MKKESTISKLDDQEKSSEGISCSVCIATYKRPHLLKKLLKSLSEQMLSNNIEIEIIIVDNDSDKSAESVVRDFQNEKDVRISYFNQPVQNISMTRNMAVAKASGQYLLFIDDDEVASPNWVRELLQAQNSYQADGVFGPVIPEFNENTPKWMRRSDLFYSPVTVTGSKARFKWTSNCMIRAELLGDMKEPFDPRYGITGGEDTHLFNRLEKQGAHFVYCMEAWVSEYLPPDRTCLSYLLKRAFKGGNGYTRRMIELSGKWHLLLRPFFAGKAFIFMGAGMAITLFLLFHAVLRTQWMMKIASNLGHFSAAFGFHYKGYGKKSRPGRQRS